jgi:hypothetical protein
VVFHVLTALGRERIGEAFSPSRYVYIDAVFLLPVLGIALGSQYLVAATKVGPGLRILAVALVVACTVGNVDQGVGFARSRTSYVLMLKAEIEGSAQLLAGGQAAIAVHPISWSSGLTPQALLSLERRRLLPMLHLTDAQRATDETILDVTVTRHRLVTGRFAPLVFSDDATIQTTGRDCVTVRARGRGRPAQLVLGLAGTDRSAAVHFSGTATKISAFLTPASHAQSGEVLTSLNVPAGGAWVSDAEPGDNLGLDVPAGRDTFCDLSLLSRDTLATAQHSDAN